MSQKIIELDGRVIVVAGAGGGGIGTACTRLIARAGATVIAVDRSKENLDQQIPLLLSQGLSVTPVIADVLTPEGVSTVIEYARAAEGQLYGLVTVVGGAPRGTWGSSTRISRDDWRETLDLNLDSMFFMTQAVAAELKASGNQGSLVSITSASGLNAAPFHVGYGAAKAAIRSVVQSMALELASVGIRVNAVAPGTTATPGNLAEVDLQRDRAAIPMQRRGTPDEIAGAALFLLSDLSSYMTGQCLAVDGGSLLRWSLIGEDNIPRYVGPVLREAMKG